MTKRKEQISELPSTVDGMLALIKKEGLYVTGLANDFRSSVFCCYVGPVNERLRSGYVKAATALQCLQTAYRVATDAVAPQHVFPSPSIVPADADLSDLLGDELPEVETDDLADLLG